MTDQPVDTLGGAAELQQKFFEDNVNDVTKHRKRFLRENAARRGTAYLLKAISIFGAIIVAAKIQMIPQTVLGLVIAGAVGLDQLTSNHTRLLAVVAAQHASDRLLAKIRQEHSAALPEIVSLAKKDTGAAAERLSLLVAKLNEQISQGREVILDGVREADLKSLNNLYVDVKKA